MAGLQKGIYRSCCMISHGQHSKLTELFHTGYPALVGLKQRPKRGKVETSSKHWYQEQIMPWDTKHQLYEELCNNIIYEDKNIVAFNKPNGLPMHGIKYSEESPQDFIPNGQDISMSAVIEDLKEKLNAECLTEIFSQNRLHSGVIAYAKNEKTKNIMTTYFKTVKTNKLWCQKYLILLNGIPKEEEMSEEFPVERKRVGEWLLTTRAATVTKKGRMKRQIIVPKIKYSVVETFKTSQCNLSLVQVETSSTRWDCLPVYFVHKLCPVIGDHKNSSRVVTLLGRPVLNKLDTCVPAPQILPFNLTKMLGLDGKETFHVPLHIHCTELNIPDISKAKRSREMLCIKAPLSEYFEMTLGAIRYGTKG